MSAEKRPTRILACVDLTDEAGEVLAAAKAQAAFHETADLHLISIVKPIMQTHAGIDAGAASALAGLDGRQLDHAQQIVDQLAQQYAIPNRHTHIKMGHPATEIRQFAQTESVDLIVIGTHSRHGLGRLLGSTANAVLHSVPCNVMVVRIDHTNTENQPAEEDNNKDAA